MTDRLDAMFFAWTCLSRWTPPRLAQTLIRRVHFTRRVKIIHDGGSRGFVQIETLATGRKDDTPFAVVD